MTLMIRGDGGDLYNPVDLNDLGDLDDSDESDDHGEGYDPGYLTSPHRARGGSQEFVLNEMCPRREIRHI